MHVQRECSRALRATYKSPSIPTSASHPKQTHLFHPNPKMALNISQSLFFAVTSFALLALPLSSAQNLQQDYLNSHNAARKLVNVVNVTWDSAVAAYALNYAQSRVGDCSLVHSNGPYGENLAKGTDSFSGVAAVNLWVAEKQYYHYASNSCTGGKQCLHYTQVVWHDSLRIGCARVQCNNGWWFVTCNYDPPGNWVGEWPYWEGFTAKSHDGIDHITLQWRTESI